MKQSKFFVATIIVFLGITGISFGQTGGPLSRNISLTINRQRLDHVLEIISNQANFYFSYNSNIVNKDSLVSFTAQGKTVREVLDIIFNKTYEFRESGNYIIIRKAP